MTEIDFIGILQIVNITLHMMQIFLLLSTLIYTLNSASSSPIFTASSLISAGTSQLFTAVPTSTLLTFTINFSPSLSGIPYFAYGLQ